MTRAITIKTQLDDALLFSKMSSTEELGRLFSISLETRSSNTAVELETLLGTPMTIKAEADDGTLRYFSGIVAEAEQIGFVSLTDKSDAGYNFVLVPRAWLLTRKSDCRIYKNLSVKDIIEQIFKENGYTDYRMSLNGTYPKRDYCVQYRESYFNFISRLMEQEGIYYYFVHDEKTHTMVLVDDIGAHSKIKPNPQLNYRTVIGTNASEWSITNFRSQRGIDTKKYQITDYDPLKPRASLQTPEQAGSPETSHNIDSLSSFDYPGTHIKGDDGARYAQVVIDSTNAAHAMYSGVSDALTLATGTQFELKSFPRDEFNQDYLVTGSSITLEGGQGTGFGTGYTMSLTFQAISSKQPFRTVQATPRPSIVGLQTAVVCGSKTTEDIAVDQHGRVQVIFHWNKPDRENHDVSCPVRVSSPWAGKQWGAINIPRVGQEVVVSFLEGDPDRPLIIGSVYNADNMPPYDLPANQTQFGFKSRSHLGVGANANELRFEDKKGSEELFLHAERNMTEEVEVDHSVTVGNDELETVKRDVTRFVNRNERVEITKNHGVVTRGNDAHIVQGSGVVAVTKNYIVDVGDEILIGIGDGDEISGASEKDGIDGMQISPTAMKTYIQIKKDGSILISGKDITVQATGNLTMSADMNVKIKAGMNMNLEAGIAMAIKGDVSLDAEGGAMATVKAPMLTLKGDGIAQLSGGILMVG